MSSSIAGRYELLEPVGSGGMGRVTRARDTVLDREVAIKLLPEEVADDPKRRERFEREARAGARLSHPNILAVHDFGMDDGQPYAVMELLEGSDLRTRLVEGPLPWRDATDVALQAARGLAAAHREGVIHRDLKPANLFLCADGTVKILDFGLARLEEPRHTAEDDGLEDSTLTATGVVMGTAAYMAPEQVRGQPADGRSDLFALGCVLHEALSGVRPFRGDSSAEIMSAILRDEPAPIAEPIPKALREVVHRCLRKDPDRRFGSAAEVVAALEAIRSSGNVELSLEPVVEETPQRTAGISRRTVAWAAAVGLAGIVIASALIAWQQSTQVTGPPPDLGSNRIAVVPFANRTGDPSLEDLGALAADRISQGLANLDEVEVAPASAVRAAAATFGSATLVRDVAAATSSALVVSGTWDAFGDGLELQATLEDARTGALIHAFDPIAATRDTPQEAIATLRDWTLMAVQDHLHPVLAWGSGDRFPVYEAYLMHRRYFETFMSRGPGVNTIEAIQLKFRATQVDPLFARPRIQTGGNWIPGIQTYIHEPALEFYEPVHEMELTPRQQRLVAMIDSRLEGRWENAFRLAQDEFERDPSDSWQRAQLIASARFDHRPGVVLDLFEELEFDSLTPETFRFTITRFVTDAYHRLRRHEEELAVARRLLHAGPTTTTGRSPRRLELRALAAMGRMDEIDEILTEVKLERDAMSTDGGEMLAVVDELRAHGFLEESRELAERVVKWYEDQAISTPEKGCDPCLAVALEAAGRRDEACGLYESALADEPNDRWLLQRVGICAARHGDRSKAVEMEARIEEIGEPTGPSGIPNAWRGSSQVSQAGIATQLGEPDRAIRLIQQAIAAGFADYELLHVDSDFDALRDDPEFQDIVRPKG